MGMRDSYQQRRSRHTCRESEATLEHMQEFFADGGNWIPNAYSDADGRRCLVGAANHVRVSSLDDAKVYLRLAIAEHEGLPMAIETFNDRQSSYAQIAPIIERARELARAAQLPAPVFRQALPAPASSPVPQILPPERETLPAPALRQGSVPAVAPSRGWFRARRPSLSEFLE
jgi:hypothetical protein